MWLVFPEVHSDLNPAIVQREDLVGHAPIIVIGDTQCRLRRETLNGASAAHRWFFMAQES